MSLQDAPDYAALAHALLAWYAAQRRDLPWRRATDPYRLWVAEVMLQQTQVSTAIPYYARFLARFPGVEALAAAPLDAVLALWQGLGYYARARSLHRAAQIVCAQHGGQVPSDPATLRALPGIGAYTAGAILSIAFGQDEPALDGNAIRVLCRLADYAQDPATTAGKAALRGYAMALLPHGQAGAFNQAMMELGATVCTPRDPRCAVCPLAEPCRARAVGTQLQRPVARARRPSPQRALVAALVEREGKLLLVRRRPQGLLGGLWELPGGEISAGEGHAQALARALSAELGLQAEVGEPLAIVRHAYSHFRVTVQAHRCTVQGTPRPAGPWDDARWLALDALTDYGLTGVTHKILAHVAWPRLV